MKRRTLDPRLLAVALLAVPACSASAQVRAVRSHGPDRAFGYFAGDLVEGTADIVVTPGTVLEAASLPSAGPVSATIDLRKVEARMAEAPDGTHIVVRATYQGFLAPDQVTRADVPGYRLAFDHDGARSTVAIPGFGFTVAPFRHDLEPVLDPAVLRPDHPPALADATVPAWHLATGAALAGGSVLLLLSGLGWPGLPRPTRPFARAARSVARLARDGGAPQDALLAVHRAFDAAAGRRVFADELEAFLAARPSFRPLQGEIEAFFATSREAFFAGAAPPPARALAGLCRDLTRAERRA